MTVALAKERLRAISDPIDYHAIIVSGRQWQRASNYAIPALLTSIVFNLPKFFELKVDYISVEADPLLHGGENGTEKVRILYT